MEYAVVLLATCAALVVIIDSRTRDPYFAFYEIVPGMGIGDAALGGDPRVRAAIIRRFGYGFLLGIALAIFGATGVVDGIAAGTVVTTLLLWPMITHGFPRQKLKRDAYLVVLYVGVLSAYVGAVVAGQHFYLVVAGRDLITYVRDRALEFTFALVLVALGFGILDPWYKHAPRRSDEP